VCVFVTFHFLLEVMYCEGCWKQERALVALNFSLEYDMTVTDCCEWEGVKCNTTTGRVTQIELQYAYFGGGSFHYSDFAIFKDLKALYLPNAKISNCTTAEQGYFSYKVNMNLFLSQ